MATSKPTGDSARKGAVKSAPTEEPTDEDLDQTQQNSQFMAVKKTAKKFRPYVASKLHNRSQNG